MPKFNSLSSFSILFGSPLLKLVSIVAGVDPQVDSVHHIRTHVHVRMDCLLYISSHGIKQWRQNIEIMLPDPSMNVQTCEASEKGHVKYSMHDTISDFRLSVSDRTCSLGIGYSVEGHMKESR